ncbi:protein sidekick-1-like [Branchiostoma lanceolatum]|uniref:protein sidekick-1-like n=1 Tax=Branchiostoma lanceolatum TaxID=7740 RepID=UPI0034531F04
MKSVWIASLLVFVLSAEDVVAQITFDCPSPQTGLANNPFLIYCVVTSDGGEVPGTSWLFDSVIVPNQGDRTTSTMNGLILQNLLLTDAGDWVCTGELSNGFTDTVTVRIIVDDFPGPPLNLALESPRTSSVLVTFDRPEGSEPLVLTQWTIEYRASGEDAWTTVIETDTDQTEFTIAGLVLQETYAFRVAAETGAGKGDYSQEVSITITEVTTLPPTTTTPTTHPPQQTSAQPPSTTPAASLANNTETSPTIGQQSGDPQPSLNSILPIVLGLLAALIVFVLVGAGVYVWCKRSRRRVVCQTQNTAKTPPA